MRTRNRPEDDKSSGSSVTDGDADLWNQKCVRLEQNVHMCGVYLTFCSYGFNPRLAQMTSSGATSIYRFAIERSALIRKYPYK